MRNPIFRAWVLLVVLSAASVLGALAVGAGVNEHLVGSLVLLLAWLKARVILSRYLQLWRAPVWKAGFNWVLGVFCLVLLGLYLAPAISS